MNDAQRHAARLLCIGFQGIVINDHARRMLDRGVGGICLFGRNVESVEQVARLVADLKAYAGRPIYVAVDHEGGRVFRFPEPFTRVPSMRALGATGDAGLARDIGRVLGSELRACGIDVDFAPVMDVDSNPDNPIIGDRALAADPETVCRLGIAVIEGIQSTGTAACAKHFPGHGDTDTDSHLDLPRLSHDMARLEQVELPPFRAAIEAGVASVMTAHILFPALDADNPATMSEPAIAGLLRGRMGYDGLVFTDDLEMKAIADHFGFVRGALGSIAAGADAVLVTQHEPAAAEALDALLDAVDTGRLTAQRIAQSIARLDALLARVQSPDHPTPPLSIIGCADHQAIARRLAAG